MVDPELRSFFDFSRQNVKATANSNPESVIKMTIMTDKLLLMRITERYKNHVRVGMMNFLNDWLGVAKITVVTTCNPKSRKPLVNNFI